MLARPGDLPLPISFPRHIVQMVEATGFNIPLVSMGTPLWSGQHLNVGITGARLHHGFQLSESVDNF